VFFSHGDECWELNAVPVCCYRLHIAISLAFCGLIVLSNYYIYGNTLLVLDNGKQLLMGNCIF
jgi:hypothetical protein